MNKKTLLNFWLLLLCMIVGASSAWADETIATLPFSWEGGTKSELTALDGVSESGLGGDYAVGNAPYRVKLDNTGDYILIHVDSQPNVVEIGVKMIGGSSDSSIKVQGSSDGTSFTDIETLTISGKQNDVLNLVTTNSFNSSHRYVKLLFTKGSNVGVGPISISKVPASVDELSVKTAPTKTRYEVGEKLDMTGFVLDADGTEINDGYTMTMDDSSITDGETTLSSVGKKTITVSYGGKTVEQAISVGAVTGISVTTPPTKTSYDTGDSFDPTGMVVTASLSTGEPSKPDTWTKTVTGYTVFPEDDLAPANTSVTITYATKTTTQTITVTNVAVTGVSVKASTTIEKSKTETLTPTFTPSNATNKTVTWYSDNTSVATVIAGVVKAVAAGTANITVTTEDGGKTATCEVTVVNPKGTADNPYTVAEVINETATGTDKYIEGYIVGSYNATAPQTGADRVNSNVALADSYNETSGSKTIPVQLAKDTSPRTSFNVLDHPLYMGVLKVLIKADIATYFSVSGLKNIDEMSAIAEAVTVSDAGFATYVSENVLDFTSTTIKAYKVKVSSKGVAKLTKVDKVPANTPVLLYKDGGATEDIPVIASADPVSDNDLVAGSDAAVPTTDGEGNTNMILNVVDDQIGFYFANGKTVASNRAYLHIANELAPDAEGGSSRMMMVFADETTGITSLTPNLSTKGEGSVYTLSGQRVEKPTKGLYIVNGKKVIIK